MQNTSHVWRQCSKKGGSVEARRPFPFAFLKIFELSVWYLLSLPFLPWALIYQKKVFQGASFTFLLFYHSISFWKRVLQSALQCKFFYSEYLFHIHVLKNHNVNWEKKPTNESDVLTHFLLCCVSFPSLLPFPCKEL